MEATSGDKEVVSDNQAVTLQDKYREDIYSGEQNVTESDELEEEISWDSDHMEYSKSDIKSTVPTQNTILQGLLDKYTQYKPNKEENVQWGQITSLPDYTCYQPSTSHEFDEQTKSCQNLTPHQIFKESSIELPECSGNEEVYGLIDDDQSNSSSDLDFNGYQPTILSFRKNASDHTLFGREEEKQNANSWDSDECDVIQVNPTDNYVVYKPEEVTDSREQLVKSMDGRDETKDNVVVEEVEANSWDSDECDKPEIHSKIEAINSGEFDDPDDGPEFVVLDSEEDDEKLCKDVILNTRQNSGSENLGINEDTVQEVKKIPIPERDEVCSILKLDKQEKTTSSENSFQKKKSVSFSPGTKESEIHSKIEAINCGELDNPDDGPEFVVLDKQEKTTSTENSLQKLKSFSFYPGTKEPEIHSKIEAINSGELDNPDDGPEFVVLNSEEDDEELPEYVTRNRKQNSGSENHGINEVRKAIRLQRENEENGIITDQKNSKELNVNQQDHQSSSKVQKECTDQLRMSEMITNKSRKKLVQEEPDIADEIDELLKEFDEPIFVSKKDLRKKDVHESNVAIQEQDKFAVQTELDHTTQIENPKANNGESEKDQSLEEQSNIDQENENYDYEDSFESESDYSGKLSQHEKTNTDGSVSEHTDESCGVFKYEYENPEDETKGTQLPEKGEIRSILKLDEQEKIPLAENSLEKKKSISFYPGTKVREIHSRIEAIMCGELDDPDDGPEIFDSGDENEDWSEDVVQNTLQNSYSDFLGFTEETAKKLKNREENGCLDDPIQYCYSDKEMEYYNDDHQYDSECSTDDIIEYKSDLNSKNLEENQKLKPDVEPGNWKHVEQQSNQPQDMVDEYIPQAEMQPKVFESNEDHYDNVTCELRGDFEYENIEEVPKKIPLTEKDSVCSILKLDEQEKTTSTENSLQKKKSDSFSPGTKEHSKIEAINCGELDDPDDGPEFVVLDSEEDDEKLPVFQNMRQNSENIGINVDAVQEVKKIPIPEKDEVCSILKLDEQEKTTSNENSLQKLKSFSFYPGTKKPEIRSKIEAINCGELDDPDDGPEFVVLDSEEDDEKLCKDIQFVEAKKIPIPERDEVCSILKLDKQEKTTSSENSLQKKKSVSFSPGTKESEIHSKIEDVNSGELDDPDDGPDFVVLDKQEKTTSTENSLQKLKSFSFYPGTKKPEIHSKIEAINCGELDDPDDGPDFVVLNSDEDDEELPEDVFGKTRQNSGSENLGINEDTVQEVKKIPIPERDDVCSILKLDKQEKTTSSENSLQKKKSVSFSPGTKENEIHSKIEAINC
ncbi:hypothetical protein LOTGIDRAFT_176359, partial [Lottia gigantea]